MQAEWEQRYLSGDTPWEKGSASPGLLEYLEHHSLEGKVLVPGCGYGHDVRAIASPRNEVIGIDIAPSAIQAANGFPRVTGEAYELADLFDLPEHFLGRFDWVWEHTCFCAMNPALRPDYIASLRGALKANGRLLAVFYMDPAREGDGPPFGVTVAELDRLFGRHFTLLEEWQPTSTYAGREGRELMRLLAKRG